MYIFAKKRARLNSPKKKKTSLHIQALHQVQESRQPLPHGQGFLRGRAVIVINSLCSRLEAPRRGGEHDSRAASSHPVHVRTLRRLSE